MGLRGTKVSAYALFLMVSETVTTRLLKVSHPKQLLAPYYKIATCIFFFFI